MEFFDTIHQVKSNWNPYKKWALEQQEKEAKNEELRKKYPPTPIELKQAEQYGRTIIDVINTMDQHSIDKSEDASLMVQTYAQLMSIASLGLFFPFNKLIKKLLMVNNKNLAKYAFLITLFIEGAFVNTTVNILRAKYEKQASRIARYQTREKDLKDYRHFVIYDEQQIKEANEIAKTLSDVKEYKKPFKKGFHPIDDYKNAKKTTDELKADCKNYENWKNEYSKEEALKLENFKKLHPSKEELEKAEKDKEVLLSTIKKVETSSLDYLNNVSMSISLAITGVSICSVLGTQSLNILLEKLQNKIKFLQKNPKLLPVITATDIFIIPLLLPILLLTQTIKLQKDAARVGRFKAKEELLNNPEKFITYNQSERKQILNQQNKKEAHKSFFKKIISDFKEINQYKKDYQEYHNYMETKHKEDLKLDEALKQISISGKQQREAIRLQKKAFYSFEKMDEKAQRFTDDTDAAVDIISQLAMGITSTILRLWGLVRGSKLMMENKNASANKMFKAIFPIILPELIFPIFNIIGTRIKKDAGKIGIMTAMNDLDDPRNFLDNK